ncbi:GIY-YIG nuclease family protein [Candidiatus Paracoxiella cheracis]|uniref:GIY-YIG nuclease family protein n=1 Tax=Candidiatus Paracoxiella cheracis TaxID=3405120 RepID=UPI003BF5C6BC
MNYFIYILECVNGNFYTGYTADIKRRYQEHIDQSNKCKYTRSFPPKRIAACWEITGTVSLVLKIEKAIKSLTKKEKVELVAFPDLLFSILLPEDQHKIKVCIKNNDHIRESLTAAVRQ